MADQHDHVRVGPFVRQRLGRFEEPAAEAYRRPFIDLDDLARTLARLDRVCTVLEVGAGEGAMATRVVRAFPQARYLGIDIIRRPGRLFRGDEERAQFCAMDLEDLPPDQLFDLVLLVDVLHHVAPPLREKVLAGARRHVRSGGHLAIKEWERTRSLGQMAWFIVDRYIGGDPNVRAFAPGELMATVARVCPGDQVTIEARVPPRRNNLLLVIACGGPTATDPGHIER